jgi:fatty-acid desaturase
MKYTLDSYIVLITQLIAHLSFIPMIMHASWYHWLIAYGIAVIMGGIGIGMINHRYLTHKAFKFNSDWVRNIFLFIAVFTLQGPSLSWVAIHREHHAYTDREKDPHGPHHGFINSYFGFVMHEQKVAFVKDYVKHKELVFLYKYHWLINISLIVILYLIFGFMGPIVGFLVPGAYVWFVTGMVNIFSHMKNIGYRNYETKDNSVNLPFLAYVSLGEAWHNNHHGDPRNPYFSTNKKEFDLIGSFISFLKYNKIINVNQ